MKQSVWLYAQTFVFGSEIPCKRPDDNFSTTCFSAFKMSQATCQQPKLGIVIKSIPVPNVLPRTFRSSRSAVLLSVHVLDHELLLGIHLRSMRGAVHSESSTFRIHLQRTYEVLQVLSNFLCQRRRSPKHKALGSASPRIALASSRWLG